MINLRIKQVASTFQNNRVKSLPDLCLMIVVCSIDARHRAVSFCSALQTLHKVFCVSLGDTKVSVAFRPQSCSRTLFESFTFISMHDPEVFESICCPYHVLRKFRLAFSTVGRRSTSVFHQ